jgi:modulator of FtsH protease
MAFEFEERATQGAKVLPERVAFVRSVYLWLMAGFGVAALGAVGALASLPMLSRLPVSGRAFMWILFFAQMGAVFFASAVSRKRPLNILAYGLFTGISGYVAGLISLMVAAGSGYKVVLAAAGLTAGVFLALTATAFVSKKDFSFLRSFVVVGIAIAFFGWLIAIFFNLPSLSLVVSAVVVIAFSAKLLWDTSAMLRTDALDDAAGFALSLFVSLYNIFISLLNLLGNRRS